MLNSAKIIPADQSKCAISEKNKGDPPLDPPLVDAQSLINVKVLKIHLK